MNKKLALTALVGTLTVGNIGAVDEYFVVPQLLNAKGRDKENTFFTPGREYFLGVYIENKNDQVPFTSIDNIQWKFGEIKGGEITQAFSPTPFYLFSDYFVEREMDSQTNSVNLYGGTRAIPQETFQTNKSIKTEGLIGVYRIRTYSDASELELALTNVQSYSFTSPTSSVPVNLETHPLKLSSVSNFKVPLDISKIDHHPWNPDYQMPNYVLVQSNTNTHGFFEMLEESTDLKNWRLVRIEDDNINYFTSTTNFPAAFYRVRMQEWKD